MAEKIPVKGNDGFFLQVDKIFLDLLHCTDLNIYGILILAQVYEFKRHKKPCIMSTQSFCDLFKTSHYTIENQLKILCDLNLIHKAIKTNQKNTISRVRHLTIPQNFTKTMEHLLKNMPDKQAQNFEVPSGSKRKNLSDLQPTNLGVASSKKASSNFDDKQPTNSYQSNPKNLRNNNIIDESNINNKLLEGNNMPSLTSSTDDLWNATDSENVGIPSVINDANFDAILTQQKENDFENDFENNFEEDDEVENSNRSKRKPNHVYDEATVWYHTKLNPISRYYYETKYKSAAMNFAWGERARRDNQEDYYTVDQILEYFTKENQLKYLEQIGWIDTHRKYLEEIKWEHLWMFPAKENI